MKKESRSIMKAISEKLNGGLKMTWPSVILFAVGTAVLTAVFLLVPVFRDTSFERMGVTFEAWIFFAIIIMANCQKPLESAGKTFVFFLISQPLIYLIQVPFSSMGWSLFGYYKYWFLWTLLTFPMAYVGWYIKKKNWLSLLILSPILIVLTTDYVGGFRFAYRHFPYQIVMALFCLGQVLLYLVAFTKNRWQRMVGFFLPLVIAVVMLLARPQVSLSSTQFLPDDLILTENAVVTVENGDAAEIAIAATGADSMIRIHAEKYGTTTFRIDDGETSRRYIMVIYEDDQGHAQIRIEPKEPE